MPFIVEEDIEASTELAKKIIGPVARMLESDEFVLYNQHLVTPEAGSIWYGDLDIMADRHKIVQLANWLGNTVYVVSEGFTQSDLHAAAHLVITSTGEVVKSRW